jgi:P-type Ca2+ transporter type 2C
MGLSSKQAADRIKQDGFNSLIEKKKTPAWVHFVRQFKDVMILILIGAAGLSVIAGEKADSAIILVIVLLNAIIGFVQEYRAEKTLEALKKMTTTYTMVIRDGIPQKIASIYLVVGDEVLLEAGDSVPADIELVETYALKADESSLTGESISVEKDLDYDSKIYKGTLITNGRARGNIVATGMSTEIGKIAAMLQTEDTLTPLQQRMSTFGKNLSYLILFICAILFVSGLIRGEDPLGIFLLAISLAVAAIPEALPALITIALSRGAARLAKNNALVRKLPAVETLGSVNYICTDKTGTLTRNIMEVTMIHNQPTLETRFLEALVLNNDVKIDENGALIGDPTEKALSAFAIQQVGIDGYLDILKKYPRIMEIPFDSVRKCMSTVHALEGGKFLMLTKGASERIQWITGDEETEERTGNWAKLGIRVLAFSYKIVDDLAQCQENEMTYLGLAGMKDPPRAEIYEAIKECKSAGIVPVMITGDHPDTAQAIAAEIGILNTGGRVITGIELEQIPFEDFENSIEKISVYARVSPAQKLKIVHALQKKGHFVAMTGDGVNDAPSLKAANIGVAMGVTGTEVSKEAAHIILLDDNFATIVKAVKEGRRIFDNIRKFIKYIMTCNSAEIWTIVLAPMIGMPIPLLPIHILWINLVTDSLPALALAKEKPESDIMHRPPRATNETMFSDGVGYHIIWVGILMAGITLGVQAYALHEQIDHWQTMVFTVLSLAQLGHVLGVRSDRTFLYRQGIASNLPLIGSVALTFLLQLGVIYLPFMNELFKTHPLSIKELSICIIMAIIVFHAVELEKYLRHLKNRKSIKPWAKQH